MPASNKNAHIVIESVTARVGQQSIHKNTSFFINLSMFRPHLHALTYACFYTQIQTNSKTYFYIEVRSPCFEGLRKTPPNNDYVQVQDSDTYVRPVWRSKEPVISIQPIVKEEEYLEAQHLLLLIKSQESDEPYGE